MIVAGMVGVAWLLVNGGGSDEVTGFCDGAGELLDWGIMLVDGVGDTLITVTLGGGVVFEDASSGTTIVRTLLKTSHTAQFVNLIHIQDRPSQFLVTRPKRRIPSPGLD